jgi:hypothetical protein
MLNIEQINKLQAELDTLLVQLRANEISLIEYGEGNVGGVMSYLRIRYMMTAGGMQFRLTTLIHHVEGSGHYVPSVEEMRILALDAVLYYHRDTGIARFRKAFNADTMKWFAVEPLQEQLSIAKGAEVVRYRGVSSFLKDAEVVTLSLEDKPNENL